MTLGISAEIGHFAGKDHPQLPKSSRYCDMAQEKRGNGKYSPFAISVNAVEHPKQRVLSLILIQSQIAELLTSRKPPEVFQLALLHYPLQVVQEEASPFEFE